MLRGLKMPNNRCIIGSRQWLNWLTKRKYRVTSHKPVCKAGMRLWSCTDLSKTGHFTPHNNKTTQHWHFWKTCTHTCVYDSGKFVYSLTMLQDRLTKKTIRAWERAYIQCKEVPGFVTVHFQRKKPIWDPTPTRLIFSLTQDFMKLRGLP